MSSSSISNQKREGSTAPSSAFRLLVVGVLAAATICVLGALVWLLLNRDIFMGPGPEASTAASDSLSARQAFERALPVARDWQLDANLTGLSANWRAARLDDLAAGAPDWAFTFFSASAGERRSVVVSSGAVRALAPRRPRAMPPVVDLSHWQIDSQAALALFLVHGGQDFIIIHEPVDSFLTLTLSEDGRLQWVAMALDASNSEFHEVIIDATTGSVQ